MQKETNTGLKIAVLHAHNTFNNGSFALLLNFMFHFSKRWGAEVEFHIELDGAENEKRLSQSIGNQIKWKSLPLTITRTDKVNKVRSLYRKWFVHYKYFHKNDFDAIVVLGGDDLAEYYKSWQVASDLIRLRQYAKLTPVYLLSQTPGPFYSWRKNLAKNAFTACNLFCRDQSSFLYCKEKLGVENAFFTADLAWLDLPGYKAEDEFDLPENFLCIVPGGFYQLYTESKNDYLAFWKKMLSELLSNLSLSKDDFVFLPHVSRPEDDRLIIHHLSGIFKDNPRCIFILDELSPEKARHIIGKSRFLISSRMHACISALKMKVPAIPIPYSVKYKGLYMAFPEMKKLVKGPFTPDSFPSNVLEEILEAVDALIRNEDQIKKQLPVEVNMQEKLAEMQISVMVLELLKRKYPILKR